MATKYKKIADDMRHESFHKMTHEQYVKCKEAIHKCVNMSLKILSLSPVMLIDVGIPIGAARLDMIQELGKILCRKMDKSEASKILSNSITSVSCKAHKKKMPGPLSVIRNASEDVTEAVAWTAVAIIFRTQLDQSLLPMKDNNV